MKINNKIVWIILKYSSLILGVRLALTLIGGALEVILGEQSLLIVGIILLVPALFAYWLISYNGIKKLALHIKFKIKLELIALLIPFIPFILEVVLNFLVAKQLSLVGPAILFCVGAIAISRASSDIFKISK